jgi:hypothetical protein
MAEARERRQKVESSRFEVRSSRRIRNEGSDPGLACNPQTLAGNLQVRLEVEHTAKEKAIFSYLPLFLWPLAGAKDVLRKFYD